MLVSDLVSQYQNSLNSGSKISTKTKGIEQLSKTVASLEKGQVFEGTVNAVKGDKVTLALSSGQTITASLDRAIQLLEGQSVFFQVKSNEGGKVEIRPISSEFGGNPTLLNALKSAGLPETEANLKLINAMMKEQMPIDAASIKDMIRTMKGNPGADIDTLVSMKKLDIPINQSMITQFENYKQSEGAILKMVNELSNDIPKAFSSENVSKGDLINFQNDLVKLLEESIESAGVAGKDGLSGNAPGVFGELGQVRNPVEGSDLNVLTGVGTKLGEAMSMPETITGSGNDVQDAMTVLQNAGSRVSDAASLSETMTVSNGIVSPESIGQNAVDTPAITGKDNPDLYQGGNQNQLHINGNTPNLDSSGVNFTKEIGSISQVLSEREQVVLNRVVSEFPEIKSFAPELFDEEGNLKPETKVSDFMKAVNSAFSSASTVTKEDMIKFLDTPPVKSMINDLMGKAWTLEPKELIKKNSINELYEKIESDMEKIIQSSKSNTHTAMNPVADTAQLVKDNLSFIREVNQLYQYVQIPLMMSGEKTTGELFVYANKKQKRAENDEITAFLHFDMDNLGSTDISVKMAGKKLNTQFFLEDEISFQIIENNIHILKERLDSLGYDCKLDVVNDSNKVNFVEDFLKQDSKSAGPISRYSFDVRA